jgi:stringent starvation protein B
MGRTGEEPRADQKTTIERLLDDEQVLVHINTTVTGVVVPSHLMQNKTVTLRLSRYFKGQLHTDTQKITAELLFGSVYHTCVIPWESIWGASAPHGEEFLWKEAAPDEIAHLLHDKPSTSSKGATTTTPKTPISRSGSPRKQVGHLRRIK